MKSIDPGLIVRGRVLDRESGLPVTQFRVQAFGLAAPEELVKGVWFSDEEARG